MRIRKCYAKYEFIIIIITHISTWLHTFLHSLLACEILQFHIARHTHAITIRYFGASAQRILFILRRSFQCTDYIHIHSGARTKQDHRRTTASNKQEQPVRCALCMGSALFCSLSLARQIPLSLTTIAYNHNSRHAFAALVTMNRRAPREIGNDAIIVCKEFVYLRRVLW